MARILQHVRRLQWHLIALLTYTACAVFVTYPLITRFDTHIIANQWGQIDGLLSIWNLWWAATALRTGQNPFFTPMLFHPQGFDLFWLWLSFPNGLLAAPATLTAGPLVAYNLTILGSYILGGYTAFLFARRIIHDKAAALVSGAVYALTPFHMRRVLDGVMDTAAIQWVPLYLLALHSLLDRPRWWKALLCGLLVLWVGLGSWYYGLFSLLYTGMAAVVWAIRDPRPKAQDQGSTELQNRRTAELQNQEPRTAELQNRGTVGPGTKEPRTQNREPRTENLEPTNNAHQGTSTIGNTEYGIRNTHDHPRPARFRLSSFVFRLRTTVHRPSSIIHRLLNLRILLWGLTPCVIWAILVAPQLLSLMQSGDQQFGIGLHANDSNSADLIDFFLPNPFHPLWGEALTSWYTGLRPDAWLWQVSFGWVALALAAVGLRTRWRECLSWAVLLIGVMLLAMGERLHLFGQATDIPMPYALIAGLPGIRTSHRPNHILLIGMLLLALIAGYGVAALLRRLSGMRWGAAGGLVAAALLIDGWAGPLPLYSLPIPSGYAMLPPHQGGAILPIPVNLNVARAEQLWFQTAHGWPIIGGYTGREPVYPLGKYAPGVRELRYGRYEPEDILTPGWPVAQISMLSALDIRYVLFHPDLMGSSITSEREVITAMGLRPSYSDERLEIYPVPQLANPRVLGYLGDGWGGLERDAERRWRWLGAEPAPLHLYNPHDEPRSISIELHLESFLRDRPLSVSLDGLPPVTINATRAEMRRTLKLWIGPGQHVVYFSAPADRPESGDGPLRSVAVLGVAISE